MIQKLFNNIKYNLIINRQSNKMIKKLKILIIKIAVIRMIFLRNKLNKDKIQIQIILKKKRLKIKINGMSNFNQWKNSMLQKKKK